MGKGQSTLEKHGYKMTKRTKMIQKVQNDGAVVATNEKFEKFLIKKVPGDAGAEIITEIETLMGTNHPHIVSSKNSFKDGDIYYVVTDYCQGGSLAEMVRHGIRHSESEALSRFVEICMALRVIHEKGLLHKNLTPKKIFLKQFGTVCLGEFGKVHESSKASPSNITKYMAPEVFTEQTYDAKSDIWALGCILYELCTRKPAFSAKSTVELIPKITGGPYPSLPEKFSPPLRDLLSDIFNKDPRSRPRAAEILERPVVMSSLSEKCKKTVGDLQTKLQTLRPAADSLEHEHHRNTIGSLTGNITAVVGGVISIVSTVLALSSLVLSSRGIFWGGYGELYPVIIGWVGIVIGMVGGIMACTWNISNMVNQTSKRKAVQSVVKEFNEKTDAVVIWLQEISNTLQTLSSTPGTEARDFNRENLARVGLSLGRGLGGVAELTRPVRDITVVRIVGQILRIIHFTGVVGLIILVIDILCLRSDAREMYHIRVANAYTRQSVSTYEGALLHSSTETPNTYVIGSETMYYVRSVRQAADELQKVLDELKSIISTIPSFSAQGEQEWQNMELM